MDVFKDALTLSAGVALPPLTGNGGPNGVRTGVPGQVYTDEETQLVWICNNQVSRWFPIGTADDVTVIQTNGGANTPDGVVAKGPAVWYGADLSVWLKSNKTLDTGGWVNITRFGEAPTFYSQSGDPLLPHIIIGGVDYGNVSYEMTAGTYNPSTKKTPLSWTFPSTFVDGLNNVPGGASSTCVGGQPRWPAKALFLLRSSSQTAPPYDPLLIDNDIATEYPTPNIPGWEPIKFWPRGWADALPTSTDDDTALANPINSPTGKWYYCLLMPLGPFCVGPGGSARITWNVVVSAYQVSGSNGYVNGFSGFNVTQINAVCSDAQGNIYIAGVQSPNSTGTLGQFSIANNGGGIAMFIAKLSSTLLPIAAFTFNAGTPSGNQVFPKSIAIDPSGNIIVCGLAKGTSANPGKGATNQASTGWVGQYTQSGTCNWVNLYSASGFGSGVDDELRGVDVDASGNIIVAGFVTGNQIDLGNGVLFISNGAPILIKLSNAGSVLFAYAILADPNGQTPILNDVKFDRNGNIVTVGTAQVAINPASVTGQVWNPSSPTVIGASSQTNGFILNYSSSGLYRWGKVYGTGQGSSYPLNMFHCAIDSFNNVYASGGWRGTMNLTPLGLVTSAPGVFGYFENFILKVNGADGTPVWFRTTPSTNNTGSSIGFNSITVDNNDNVISTSFFSRDINLGAGIVQGIDAGFGIYPNVGYVVRYQGDVSGINPPNYMWADIIMPTSNGILSRCIALNGKAAVNCGTYGDTNTNINGATPSGSPPTYIASLGI